ncbi:hypothetical protein IW261DRAFT_1594702 [Armillaria novae-zelandiae]|uniref:Uncharacterized protein n=1 Tax=Armillaria novae-zelandiae TaxID=153914 RepID=A0AA39P3V5_9AGAR|nr:hypothetical protein IW261DRAFT_1594702 [Armillaria novae-zelandiae]
MIAKITTRNDALGALARTITGKSARRFITSWKKLKVELWPEVVAVMSPVEKIPESPGVYMTFNTSTTTQKKGQHNSVRLVARGPRGPHICAVKWQTGVHWKDNIIRIKLLVWCRPNRAPLVVVAVGNVSTSKYSKGWTMLKHVMGDIDDGFGRYLAILSFPLSTTLAPTFILIQYTSFIALVVPLHVCTDQGRALTSTGAMYGREQSRDAAVVTGAGGRRSLLSVWNAVTGSLRTQAPGNNGDFVATPQRWQKSFSLSRLEKNSEPQFKEGRTEEGRKDDSESPVATHQRRQGSFLQSSVQGDNESSVATPKRRQEPFSLPQVTGQGHWRSVVHEREEKDRQVKKDGSRRV